VKRQLVRTPAFVRLAKRLAKKNADASAAVQAAAAMLVEDAFDPRLKTHKLSGELDGFWACSAGYDLRIIFELRQHEGQEAIFLLTVGSHDEVY
jgi:mRNA interferase YafQ